MASGAAVKGSSKRAVLYPAQLVIMVNDETVDAVERYALQRETSKSSAARAYLEPGLELVRVSERYDVPVVELIEAAELYAVKVTSAEHETTRTA